MKQEVIKAIKEIVSENQEKIKADLEGFLFDFDIKEGLKAKGIKLNFTLETYLILNKFFRKEALKGVKDNVEKD